MNIYIYIYIILYAHTMSGFTIHVGEFACTLSVCQAPGPSGHTPQNPTGCQEDPRAGGDVDRSNGYPRSTASNLLKKIGQELAEISTSNLLIIETFFSESVTFGQNLTDLFFSKLSDQLICCLEFQ